MRYREDKQTSHHCVDEHLLEKSTHSQAVHDVEEFDSSSDLEKCSITQLAQEWMLCSEWVPPERESKQLIKTSCLCLVKRKKTVFKKQIQH